MMSKLNLMRTAAAALTIASCIASCSSKDAQPPNLASMQISPAAPGSCPIDAIKMCQAEAGNATPQPEQKATMPMPSYGPPNLPDSIEFQIPAGQAIKLMCYYDPQHTSVYRADATPESPLTENSVEYMKQQGFCTKK